MLAYLNSIFELRAVLVLPKAGGSVRYIKVRVSFELFGALYMYISVSCICYLQDCDINLMRNNSNGHSMHFSELTSTYIQESAMAVRCA